MRPGLLLSAILLTCALAGCGDRSRDSLVGTWAIAPDAELARDTVTLWFRKENGTDYPGTLAYSLAPDGVLTIAKGRDHVVCCFGGIDRQIVDRRWQTRLSRGDQQRIRRMLARLRPEALTSDVPFALPKGCGFTSDERAWNGVTFAQGKRAGAFVFQHGCKEGEAARARQLLRSVVEALPRVDGAEAFLDPS